MSRVLSSIRDKVSLPKPKPKPKTYAEVFTQLVSTLCDQGATGLSEPLNQEDTKSLKVLETIYQKLALQSFASNYKYPYSESGQPPAPTNAIPKIPNVAAFDGFYRLKDSYQPPVKSSRQTREGETSPSDSEDDHTGGPISDHTSKSHAEIQQDILQKLTSLPQGAKDSATRTLLQEVDSVLTQGATDRWTATLSSHAYDTSENKYDNSLSQNVTIISVRASLTIGKVTAKLVAFYCIGVYYYTLSPATLSKQSIWSSLFDGANKLLDEPLKVSDPPTETELTSILNVYGSRRFSKDFGLDIDKTPEESVEFLGRSQQLLVFPDNNLSNLESQLDDLIMRHLQIPVWTEARKDILAETNHLVNDTTHNHGDWISIKFEHTYLPKHKADLSIVVKANFVYCIVVSPRYSDVSYRCVYISGLSYKVTGAKETINSDFIKAIYSTARNLVPDSDIPIPDAPTKDDLDVLLSSARDIKFEEKFDFVIDGPNTQPPSAVPGALFTAKGSFATETNSDTAASLVDTCVLKAFGFPEWSNEIALKKLIRDDLIQKIQNMLKQDPLTIGSNQWIVTEMEHSYNYAAADQPALSGKLMLIYCNGLMSQASQQMTLKKTFVYFSGVYYNQAELDW